MRFWKLYATSRAFNFPRWLSFKIAWNGRNGPNDKMIAAREFYLKHTSGQDAGATSNDDTAQK